MASNISLVQVTAYHYNPGDVCQWIDEHDLYSVDVDDEANVTGRPSTPDEREAHRWQMPGGKVSAPPDTIYIARQEFWGFDVKAFGDWFGTYSCGVEMVRDDKWDDELQEDVAHFVEIAERIATEEAGDAPLQFIVAYEFESEENRDWETGEKEYNCWNNYLGEVDLNRVKEIVEAPHD